MLSTPFTDISVDRERDPSHCVFPPLQTIARASQSVFPRSSPEASRASSSPDTIKRMSCHALERPYQLLATFSRELPQNFVKTRKFPLVSICAQESVGPPSRNLQSQTRFRHLRNCGKNHVLLVSPLSMLPQKIHHNSRADEPTSVLERLPACHIEDDDRNRRVPDVRWNQTPETLLHKMGIIRWTLRITRQSTLPFA